MQIVINIDEEVYEKIQKRKVNQYDIDDICQSVFGGVPLPKGHGRLIDGDALYNDYINESEEFNKGCSFIGLFRSSQTIIEADRSEEDE